MLGLAVAALHGAEPPYPRIGNCYGAGLGRRWEDGRDYWRKLGLIIGGGYDLHYDWDHERWPRQLAAVEANVARLRAVNPTVLILPYVDVVEGPDNPRLPKEWWALRDGQRWSGWPGYFRIDTNRADVLAFNLSQVKSRILSRDAFDGVFYDCWGVDDWLVPRTAQLRDGRAVVMINDWNLPRKGFEHLNGCLAEDELNRCVEGKVDFEDFLARYLRWCRDSRKPLTTMLVAHPRGVDMDAWRWSKLPWAERDKLRTSWERSDPAMMRFGLATTLLGDGYFGFDTGDMGRGNWWWYPEYDTPLGTPLGDARRSDDGTWRRDFSGGVVVSNGSGYDAAIELPRRMKNVSNGRIGTRFTLFTWDGALFVPSDEAPTPGDDVAPRVTRTPPAAVRASLVDDGVVVQTPGGLDARFDAPGRLRSLRLDGRLVASGGWPDAQAQPSKPFKADGRLTSRGDADGRARLEYRGTMAAELQRVDYVETVTVEADNRLTLHFDFTAATDLDLRMWRHYWMFPVSRYAGGRAGNGQTSAALPAALGTVDLLDASREFSVETDDIRVEVVGTLGCGLVDHRRYGSPDYLLAGYPVSGKVPAGRTWSVDTSLRATKR
jgi:hypothetical protein